MNKSDKVILKGHDVVPTNDLIEWARWFETADRKVAKDVIGQVRVSTVFIGLDHSFGEGPPLYFETLVFGGPLADKMDRYATWDEAEAGHKKMVERVEKAEARI